MAMIIAAVDKAGVMGRGQRLPWHLPKELAHFKEVTLGHPVVMGRKTFESIGKPLTGRRNIVLTRDTTWSHPGVEVVNAPEAALEWDATDNELQVIGGREVYQLFLPHVTTMMISVVEGLHEGDVYFPTLGSEWRQVSEDKKEGFTVTVWNREDLP